MSVHTDAEIEKMLRDAYEAGMRAGRQEERERVVADYDEILGNTCSDPQTAARLNAFMGRLIERHRTRS